MGKGNILALSVSAYALPPLPKGEAMLPLSKTRNRLPLWGSWQSRKALTERAKSHPKGEAYVRNNF